MNPCDPLNCGFAYGGECGTNCMCLRLHRPVMPEKLAPAVIVPGHVESRDQPVDLHLPDDGALTAAAYAYKTHRAQGRLKALSCAWRSFFRIPVQPVNQ